MSIENIYTVFTKFPSVQTDTRKLKKDDIYFALKGENFDGNQFVKQAFDLGASYAVIDNRTYLPDDENSAKCFVVDDTLQSLQELANFHRKQFSIPFIAITGSNGKTTTKELVMSVLSQKYITYATEGNLNNHIGVPLTILKIKMDAEMAIIEMGANHQKEIELYCKIAEPTHGLINNCGKAHLEGFGGIEGVKKGKGELYDYLKQNDGVIFRNADLDYLVPMSDGVNHIITYGSANADFTGIAIMNDGMVGAAITTPRNECTIKTQLVGEYNFANIMASFAIGRSFNISIEKIKSALEEYRPTNSRSQLIKLGTNTIILDAYNANPTSMIAAIQNFMNADYPNKVIIIGAMKELGLSSLEEHQKLVFFLEESNWNHVVLVGGDFAKVIHPYLYFENSSEAKLWFEKQQFKHTAILIKGSRAFAMEKVIQSE
ncbi:MAG TPA: UDP-N-acetylmuramoyl-tripeptide--D-alanyl-D-alanine ligase [Chitinophagaceae bacterium]|nr:UDP-N-acetylmuramoyl-tripeptide--D-alanyl-D-alanine ligase [Chitinophagaceae bacterium]